MAQMSLFMDFLKSNKSEKISFLDNISITKNHFFKFIHLYT